jgi:O-acetyl-ADP-ribose deacetylase (regulator of RNase III)
MNYQEIEGDLIEMAKTGHFDVITHGCNCQCRMRSGIAVQMAKEFNVDLLPLELPAYKGAVNKLGQVDLTFSHTYDLYIINSYTQYNYGREVMQLDYEALTLCLRKINFMLSGRRIGLPQIGCGLAGGDWDIVKGIIQRELKDCKVTVVIYKKPKYEHEPL